jgi:hypothetical protein
MSQGMHQLHGHKEKTASSIVLCALGIAWQWIYMSQYNNITMDALKTVDPKSTCIVKVKK